MSINIVIVSIIISTFVVVGNFATLLTYLQQYSILEIDNYSKIPLVNFVDLKLLGLSKVTKINIFLNEFDDSCSLENYANIRLHD